MFRLGALIGLRSAARCSWSVISRGSDRKYIKLICVKVEGFICKLRCGFVLQ